MTNTGSTRDTYTASLWTDLGSGGSTVVVNTSSGDTAFATDDNWIVTDDADGTGDPTVLHVIAGPGGQRPSSVSFSYDDVRYSYALTLDPGETKIVMHFGAQNPNRAAALAKAPLLTSLGLGALTGMSEAEKALVINFVAGLPQDQYTIQVNEGDSLVVTTTTPGDGAGEPVNNFDPAVQLFNEKGVSVATDDNGAGDGRNALINYTVPVGSSGAYRVVVRGADTNVGEYTLAVSGATGALPPFRVTTTEPASGTLLSLYPNTYRVNFSHPLLLASAAPDDLLVNGLPATGVTVVDNDTLDFDIAATAAGDGVYTVTMAPGAVTSLSGVPVSAFSATFDVDMTSPTVVASSISEGATVATGDVVIHVRFSEDMETTGLGGEDVTLVETLSGTSISPDSFSYDSGTATVTVTYLNLREGTYTLTLLSSATAFRDRRGNLLDGAPSFPLPSGDGTPGDPFVINFKVDNAGEAFPVTLEAVSPVGSLIYDPPVRGLFHAAGDVDTYTMAVDSGQTITVRLTPAASSIVGKIELFDPSDTSLGAVTAGAAGETAILQTAPASASGTYTFDLTSLAGTGFYDVQVVLNAALEAEQYGGASNDSIGSAQDINSSAIALQGSAERMAVLGETELGSSDYFAFDLQAGEFASLAVTSLTTGGAVSLALHDASGVLALGVGDYVNVTQAISDFMAPGAGTFYARVSLVVTDTPYSLVVTTGSTFDLEPTAGAETRNLGHTYQALGAISTQDFNVEPDDFPAGSVMNTVVAGVVLSVVGPVQDVTSLTSGLASTGSRVFGHGSSTTWSSNNNWLRADFSSPVSAVSIDVIGDDSSDPGVLQAYAADGLLLEQVITGTVPAGQPQTMTITRNESDIAYILASGWGGDTAALDNLQVTGDQADGYSFQVASGDVLEIRTTTPGGDTGEPVNNFDPVIDLFNELGFLVASDDNSGADGRNAQITYAVPGDSSGSYTVQVSGGGQGEYTINITGVTPTPSAAPVVVATTPADGQKVAAPPTALDVTLSEAIRVDSAEVADLTIDGGATVTGVELLDGRTVRFSVTVPDVEATYSYTLSAGAFEDLQGQSTAEYAGSFTIDHTGPWVVSQTPALQTSAPFTELTVTFNEAINPSTFTVADISAFIGPGGTNLLGAITGVSGSGTDFTITFDAQTVMGTYALVIGPNIEDVVGNLMDQDQNGTGGEATDTYTASVDMQSPDLAVTSITIPSSAYFGDTISVTWTVQNIGTDPASEGWSDRVYLSADTSVDAGDSVLLTESAAFYAPLGPSGEYTQTKSVTLPLSSVLSDGNYYILVQADALGSQPESNEGNNVGVSEVISLTVPAVPDLVVSDIVAPATALAGDTIEISWTLTNQGSGDATGTWTDRVFLSTDQVIGSDQYFGSFSFTGTIAATESITRTQNITLPINLSGDRYVVIRTDVYDNIFEHANEGNNAAVDEQAISISLPPLPNLQVASVTAPPTVFSGQETVIEWTITNAGTGATSAPIWYDAVYISADTVFDWSDTYLGKVANASFLNAGDSYASSSTVTVPQGLAGNFYFLVWTDRNNHVYEHDNENDNVGASDVTDVQLPPLPDLRVSTVSAPVSAFSGQTMSLSWMVVNDGAAVTAASWWDDDVYMSMDDVLGPEDTFLGRQRHFGALNPGDSYTASRDVTLPIGVSGDFYFIVTADATGRVFEHAFEGNNTGFDPTPTTVNLTPPPDLEVELVDAPTEVLAGHQLTISYRVTNFGATATPNSSWTDSFYLSPDTTLDLETDLLLGSRSHSGALGIGESYDASATFTLSNELSGTFYAFVFTDKADVVFELDNDNNVGLDAGAVTVVVKPADLVVSAASAPATGVAGGAVLVDWTVANIGTGDSIATSWNDNVWISPDNVLGGGNDTLLQAFTHTGLLNAGDSYTQSQLVSIPFSLEPGPYYLFVVADANGRVYESDNGNNSSPALPISVIRDTPDLQVTQVNVNPSASLSGEPVTVDWTVQNFGAGRTNSNYWDDYIYISIDDTVSEGDIVLGSLRRSNPLEPSEQYTASKEVVLPVDLDGDFYVLVRTDRNNVVLEDPNEDNNDRATASTIAVTFNATPDPDVNVLPVDLAVTSVDAPTEAISGQTFVVTWTVVNNEDATGDRHWADSVYLSLDQVLDRGVDTFIGYLDRFGGLAAGGSYTETQSFAIPRGMSGAFYVFVTTDSTRRIGETDEFNNANYDSTSMLVTLAPPADLVVGTITIPATGSPGLNATITYTVENQGTDPALGNWYDSIYISADTEWDVEDAFFGRVHHYGDVAGGSSYTETLTAPLPGVVPGDYHIIVRSDIRNHVPESEETNNIGASLDQATIDAQQLDLGVPASGTLGQGQSMYYRVDVPAGETLMVKFDSESATASNELYIRYGQMPTRTQFDVGFSDAFSPDQELVVRSTRGGTYFVLVFGDNVPGGPANFTISADVLGFSIIEVTPDSGSNLGVVTVTVIGSKFSSNGVISLVAPDGSQRTARRIWWKDQSEMWASFMLQGLAPGQYDVRIDVDGQTALAQDAFTVTNGGAGAVEVSISAPSAVRPARDGTLLVAYANTGGTDVMAPLIQLVGVNAVVRRPEETAFSNSIEFLGISSQGPAGILPPGAKGTYPLVFSPTAGTGEINFTVSFLSETLPNASEPIDWGALKDAYRPFTISPEAWDVIYGNFTSAVGTTGTDLLAVLSDNANHLSLLGNRVSDTNTLLSFQILQGMGLSPVPFLAASVDAMEEGPGLDLAFGRFYGSNIVRRFEASPIGRGWHHSWDLSLTFGPDGTVYFTDELGTQRAYRLDGSGDYIPPRGIHETLTKQADGSFVLKRATGKTLRFRPDGRLDFAEDHNGNRVTATYDTSNRLVQLVHSAGQSLNFTYDASGRINMVTDSQGNSSVFAYDGSGHLLSATDYRGYVTRYTYDTTPGTAAEYALLSVEYPDGSHQFYEYDALGRLAEMHRDGGTRSVAFAYGPSAKVTMTDASGASSQAFFDQNGRNARFRDPLGRVIQLTFDGDLNLTEFVDGAGNITTYQYDARGNVTKISDPLGQEARFEFGGGPLDLISLITDANGNVVNFGYDSVGNLVSRSFEDGSIESFAYDGRGLMTTLTNRRGQAITFAHDATGRLISKAYSDGTTYTYTYDARGNLTTATGPEGTITREYDISDRLIRITYPGGQYLDFTYDAAGRRSAIADHLGNTLTAQYDAVGRPERLVDDGGTPVVTYTYDSVGRMVSKEFGNGVVVTYSYDAAGQIDRIENRDASGAVISFLDYTYDATGRVTAIDTSDGLWTYTYDAVGRLILALFKSTKPSIPDQELQYFYDAAGNRTRTVVNGVSTDYTTNELNEYTQVGTVIYDYDADGNLISRTDGSDVTTYRYNPENRLIEVVRGADTWSYTYDALGHLASITHNGVTTYFVADPEGIGAIVGEYDDSGNLIARYDYGLRLIRQENAAGDPLYPMASDAGNIGEVTDGAGNVQATYIYDPFGNLITSTGTAVNPLQYVGEFGVRVAGPNLYYMRNRFYSPELGQFLSEDPLRIAVGSSRIYVQNNPINVIDPVGLVDWGTVGKGLLQVGGGILGVAVGVVAEPVTLGGSTVVAVAGAWSIGSGIGNIFNGFTETKPVLTGNLFQDMGKGIDYAAGTETFEKVGIVADLGLSFASGRWATNQGIVNLGELIGPRANQINQIISHIGAFNNMTDALAELNKTLQGTGLRAVPMRVGDEVRIVIVRPRDPNDIIGPEGFGDEKFVTAKETFPYIIRFENAADATAPAQQVTVTQQLDPDLDFRTFRVGDFGFGDLRFTVPENRAFYNERLDLESTHGFFLDVAAGVNVATGEAFWVLTTIDPATGDIPENPLLGFLPPNDDQGAGEGFLTYTIRARQDVATGDVIDAEARIVFDNEGPIDTPPIFNTIDAGVPSSQVEPLPTIAPSSDFLVEWSGSDDAGGSAISSFTIFVSDSGAPFTPWLENTDLAEATFSGQEGHTYEFYSTASDNSGNLEEAPTIPDAVTVVAGINPVVDAGADQIAEEGSTVALPPATFVDPGTANSYTAEINWGDGTTEAGVVDQILGTVAGTHVYADNDTYGVEVCVTSDDARTGCDTLAVTVSNAPPTVDAGADQTVAEGTEVSLAPATFHDQGTLDTHTATIDWGDGTAPEAGTVAEAPFGPPGSTAGVDGGVSGSHVYNDAGTFTATVTVCDDDLDCGSDAFTVSVLPPGVTPTPTPTPTPIPGTTGWGLVGMAVLFMIAVAVQYRRHVTAG